LLVVDDDMVIRSMLQRLLSEQGYSVIEAANGAEALSAFEHHAPDMVLMDAAMPVLDGFVACEEMKKSPRGKNTPVLMITALHDEESVDQAFSAGAVEYITKPIHWAVLRHRVDTLLKAQRAERALMASEARFRGVFEQAAMGIALVDLSGHIQYTNPALEQMLGQPADTLRGQVFDKLFQAAGCRAIEEEFFQQLMDNQRAYYQMEKYLAEHAGPPLWARLTASLVRGADNQPRFVIHMIEDISLRKQAQLQQRIANRVFENTTDGVMITDARGLIRDVNVPFLLAYGYGYEEVLDRKPKLLQSGHHNQAFYEKMWLNLADTGHWSGEIYNRRKDGSLLRQWLAISTVRGEHNEVSHYVGVYSEAPAEQLAGGPNENPYYVVHYDALTSLPNRLLFHERLTRACRQSENVALISLDLDKFEAFNVRHGYCQGDEVLKTIARRLQKAVHDNDLVARVEGDEFAVVLTQFSQPYDVRLAADRILEELTQPIVLDGHMIRIDCNLGISLYPGCQEAGANVETLIQYADLALYQAKSAGKNTYRIFCESELEA
jgi:diguanylate cyclase (GGDEF)-like protein/PAS domain S-box-containing protein